MWRPSHGSMLHHTTVAGAMADGVTVDGGMVEGGMVDGSTITGNTGLLGGLPNYFDERPRDLSFPDVRHPEAEMIVERLGISAP